MFNEFKIVFDEYADEHYVDNGSLGQRAVVECDSWKRINETAYFGGLRLKHLIGDRECVVLDLYVYANEDYTEGYLNVHYYHAEGRMLVLHREDPLAEYADPLLDFEEVWGELRQEALRTYVTVTRADAYGEGRATYTRQGFRTELLRELTMDGTITVDFNGEGAKRGDCCGCPCRPIGIDEFAELKDEPVDPSEVKPWPQPAEEIDITEFEEVTCDDVTA